MGPLRNQKMFLLVPPPPPLAMYMTLHSFLSTITISDCRLLTCKQGEAEARERVHISAGAITSGIRMPLSKASLPTCKRLALPRSIQSQLKKHPSQRERNAKGGWTRHRSPFLFCLPVLPVGKKRPSSRLRQFPVLGGKSVIILQV